MPKSRKKSKYRHVVIKKKKYYFNASPGYASFVRGKNVEVGDFPELDIFDDDSDDEDEL